MEAHRRAARPDEDGVAGAQLTLRPEDVLDDAVRGLVSDEAHELAALVHERADLVARRVLRVLGDAGLQLRLRLLRRADGHRLGLGAGERVADDAVCDGGAHHG